MLIQINKIALVSSNRVEIGQNEGGDIIPFKGYSGRKVNSSPVKGKLHFDPSEIAQGKWRIAFVVPL